MQVPSTIRIAVRQANVLPLRTRNLVASPSGYAAERNVEPRDKYIQLLQQVMCDMLDGRTFGRDDVLWSSQVSDEIERFLQSREKSTFHSEHEARWPGLCSLYCECFVRAVDMLR